MVLELGETFPGVVGVLLAVAVEVDPLGGSEGDFVVWLEAVSVFDDVHVLHAEAFAGAHDGAGVVGLIEILDDDPYSIGSRGEDTLDLFPPGVCEEALEEIDQGGIVMGVTHGFVKMVC